MGRAWRVRFGGSFSTGYGQRKVGAKEEKLSPDLGKEQVPAWERLVSYWVKRGEGSVPLVPCPASVRCLCALCFLAAGRPVLPLTPAVLGCVTCCAWL